MPPRVSRPSAVRRLGRGGPAAGLVLGLTLTLTLGGCTRGPDPQLELSGPTMGTAYTVKVPRPPAGLDGETLKAGVEGVLKAAVDLISTYEPDSELSRLNRNPSTDWIPVSPELLSVIAEGQRISALSGGAFDITVGPLVNLWGFGPERKADAVPSPESTTDALARVGHSKIGLRESPPALRKARADIYIDLSALGEGYGADRLAAWLESRGATDYLAGIAGTMRVRGQNAKGRPWGIAIEAPAEDRRSVQRVLPLTDRAVSTSGDYRNFFKEGGRRYSHHIDPRTGQSVAHSLASTTVVLPGTPGSAMSADGLATALIVLGESRGPALAESQPLSAYFILREDSGFRELATGELNAPPP